MCGFSTCSFFHFFLKFQIKHTYSMSKVLIYDADCPLCRAYTKGLVVAGALPAEARVPSHQITSQALLDQLDPVRRRHEIPLLDTETGETHYGVDAILTVAHRSWPRFTRFVRDTVLLDVGRRFYAFVSYNRRILFPTPPQRWHLMDLTPDFSPGYRTAFLALLYGLLLMCGIAAPGTFSSVALVGLVAQACLASVYITRHTSTPNRLMNLLDYAGHLGVCLLAGYVLRGALSEANVPGLEPLTGSLILYMHWVRTRALLLPHWLSLPFLIVAFC
jgi:predicted DCC family thiol-disulfide oxidoreductase YuxK